MNSVIKLFCCCLRSSPRQANPSNIEKKEDVRSITSGFGYNPSEDKEPTPPLSESAKEINNQSMPSREIGTIPEDKEIHNWDD